MAVETIEPLVPGQQVILKPYVFRPYIIAVHTGEKVTVIEDNGAEVKVRLPSNLPAVLSRKELRE